MSTNAVKQRFGCTKCDKSFTVPFSLRRHMAIHDEPGLYVCQQCDIRFKTKEILMRHEHIHSGERPHGCHFCSKRFVRMTDLRKHLKTHQKKENLVQVSLCADQGQSSVIPGGGGIPSDVGISLIGGQKHQPEELVNEPVAAAQNMIVFLSVGTNGNNRARDREECSSMDSNRSDKFQIIFDQIMDELAKSGSSTVNTSNF
ncbi:unnamed protein product [Orchesella dallaii]|uniref:C2H2-type domain-containing protein n=1 Tax=Orchesella dallaii TaxID=48710 RepID=A0ABP1R273_9HEXA